MVSALDNRQGKEPSLFPDMNETSCPSGRRVRFSIFFRTRKERESKRKYIFVYWKIRLLKWWRVLYWTSLGWWWNGSEINWKTNNSISFPMAVLQQDYLPAAYWSFNIILIPIHKFWYINMVSCSCFLVNSTPLLYYSGYTIPMA